MQQKETLSLSGISRDLGIIADMQISNVGDWRLSYIVPMTTAALLLGVLLKNFWIGILIFSVAAYHIVRYVSECKDYRGKKNAIRCIIDRGDISISVEKLSHISHETIYEPHSHGHISRNRHAHLTKEVTFYYFMSGGSWRVPKVDKHYTWSKEYYMSSRGLENISIQDDEFFYISLKGNPYIAYIYPCKIFALDEKLREDS